MKQRALVITATNEDGERAVYTNAFMLDRPPVVTVTSPTGGAVANGQITIDASCTDDGPDGSSSLLVVYSSASLGLGPDFASLVACGTDRIAGTYKLSRFAGTSGYVHFISYAPTGPGGVVTALPVTIAESAAGPGAVTISSSVSGSVARPE